MQALPRLLVIEDNSSLVSALLETLKTDYQIDAAPNAKSGIYKTDIYDYDAIILDLNLPDLNGLNVCQILRERHIKTPILILSAETKVLSKIQLLDAGANDYLTKPFSLGELKARLKVIRRAVVVREPKAKAILTSGELLLNPNTRHVSHGVHTINLRPKEFLILECLLLYAGQVVSREKLMRYVWPGADKPWTATIDVHIKNLRDKVDKPFNTSLISTVHRVGYKLEKQPSVAELMN